LRRSNSPKKTENLESVRESKEISSRKKSLTPSEVRNKLKRNSTITIKDNESILSKNDKKKKTSTKKIIHFENQNSLISNRISKNLTKNFNDNSKEKIIIEENHENQINSSQINTPTNKTENNLSEILPNENVKNTPNFSNKIKKEPLSNVNSIKIEEKEKYYDIDVLLNDKPELIEVPKEFKLKVLRKTIPFIERSSKNLKPGVFMYTQKLLGLSIKPAIKQKFYEILKNENLELSSLDLNIILLMGGELLHSSKENNINPSVLQMKEFNESYFENQMNPDAIEIFVKLKFQILIYNFKIEYAM